MTDEPEMFFSRECLDYLRDVVSVASRSLHSATLAIAKLDGRTTATRDDAAEAVAAIIKMVNTGEVPVA